MNNYVAGTLRGAFQEGSYNFIELYDDLFTISSRLSYFGCENIRLVGDSKVKKEFQNIIKTDIKFRRMNLKLGLVTGIYFDLPFIKNCVLYVNGAYSEGYGPDTANYILSTSSEVDEQFGYFILEALVKSLMADKFKFATLSIEESQERRFHSFNEVVKYGLSMVKHPEAHEQDGLQFEIGDK